jgi:hypothetical protein
MSAILSQAQALVSSLQTLMPSIYQQDSLQALLGLFLEGQGVPLPEHCMHQVCQCFESVFKRIQVVDTAGAAGQCVKQFKRRSCPNRELGDHRFSR